MTIRGRLTLAFAALLLVTLGICSVSVYVLMVGELQKEARGSVEALVAQAEQLAAAGGEGEHQGIGIDLTDPSLADTLAGGDRYLEVRDPHGRIVSQSASLHGRLLPALSSRTTQRQHLIETRIIRGLGPVIIDEVPIFGHGRLSGVIIGGLSLIQPYRTAAWLRDILFVVSFGAIAVAALGSWWVAGAALRPVDRITSAARSISAGALSRRLALRGPDDELHRLGAAFDDMIDRLRHAFERERQFTADAAHELRTPLTVLQGEIEVALRKPRTAQEYRESFVALRIEVLRLSQLVGDLLLLARADAGGEALPTDAVDLCSLLAQVADRCTDAAATQGTAIRLEGPDRAIIAANSDGLSRALSNMIDNALRHTKAGDTIELGWRLADDGAIIEVTDTASGIAPEHVPYIFGRFYRADSHRARGDGGSGLGLAIAKTIVEVHGGTLSVESRPQERTTFRMWLPAARAG